MNTIIFISGIIGLVIFIVTIITILAIYVNYRLKLRFYKLQMIDASGEFSVKLLTIGWNIKHANISQPQVLDEKKFEITAKRNDNN